MAKKKQIEAEYWPGDKVFVVADFDQVEQKVINVVITPNGIMYSLRINGELIDFYEEELSSGPRVI